MDENNYTPATQGGMASFSHKMLIISVYMYATGKKAQKSVWQELYSTQSIHVMEIFIINPCPGNCHN